MAFLPRLLHVRRTELDRTLRMAGIALVLGWTMYCAFNVTQAIFLVRSGVDSYPVFFILLALTVWPVVSLQGRLARRLGVERTLRWNLLVNAGLPLVMLAVYFRWSSGALGGQVAFAAYVVYSVAFELVMLLFSSFATQHFNLLEGKRIYPVIAAGSSVGYILTGITTTAVTHIWRAEGLLLVWSAGSLATYFLVRRTERVLYRPPVVDDVDHLDLEAQRHRGRFGSARQVASYLRSSRLVVAFVVMAFLLMVTMRVADYLVAIAVVRAAHRKVDDLSALIGQAWSLSYVVQLAVAFAFAPFLLNRVGVRNVILALPVATLAALAAVAALPGLASAYFLFVVRNGLQTGLDDPARNVLGAALPDQVAPRVRAFVNEVTLPLAAVAAGVLLLLLQRATTEGRLLAVGAVAGLVLCLAFTAAAYAMRGQYVSAIYAKLRAHSISLSDLERALGRPSQDELGELQEFVADPDPKVATFAAAAMGRLAPEAFASMVPQLVVAAEPGLRRLAFQLPRVGVVTADQVERGAGDQDAWVRAAAAVAGYEMRPPWPGAVGVLEAMAVSDRIPDRAAAVWAASRVVDEKLVIKGLRDPAPRVRLEAVRSFAKLKGAVPGAGDPLIVCLVDVDLQVRRAALGEAIRWTPPAGAIKEFADALLKALTSGDRPCRRLAAEALAVQAPDALVHALPLLVEGDTESAMAAVEALLRSGVPELRERTQAGLVKTFAAAEAMARYSARLAALARLAGAGEDQRFRFLRFALDDHVDRAVELGLAAMRALHGKRGFETIERGLRSGHPGARVEALETLINFGPGWLAEPLGRLLDAGAHEGQPPRPLAAGELRELARNPDPWVRRAVEEAARGEVDDQVKDLMALRRVPLFSKLTLEQLASIDRLMVTRRYLRGERIFELGDIGSELFVVVEGEVRIHNDEPGAEITLARIGASSAFGEMALFEDQPRSASAEAASDAVVRVLRKDRFQAIVHEHPEVLLEVIKYLSQRLRQANDALHSAHSTNPPPVSAPAEAAAG